MTDLTNISVANASLPVTYEQAKGALAACVSLDECKDWSDKSQALASYAKQANDETLMKMAVRIRDRAIRRAGELLKQIEPAKPGPKPEIGEGAHTQLGRQATGEQAGLSKHQQVQAIRVANVPEGQFNELVDSDTPPTVTALAEIGTKPAPKPLIDLEGRDPGEFSRSLHFVGRFENYARIAEALDIDTSLSEIIPAEAERIRRAIATIDAVHDRIITRI